jgi:hypothetical protein
MYTPVAAPGASTVPTLRSSAKAGNAIVVSIAVSTAALIDRMTLSFARKRASISLTHAYTTMLNARGGAAFRRQPYVELPLLQFIPNKKFARVNYEQRFHG